MHLRQVSTMYNLMILRCYNWIYVLFKKRTLCASQYRWASAPLVWLKLHLTGFTSRSYQHK